MSRVLRVFIWLVIFCCLAAGSDSSMALAQKQEEKKPAAAKVTLPEELGEDIQKQATKTKDKFEEQARNIFRRDPLGFDVRTLERTRQWLVNFPARTPMLVKRFSEQVRSLGMVGAILLLAFLVVVFYSVFGWKKVFRYLEKAVKPLESIITETYSPYLLAGLRVLAATLVPLSLYGLFVLVQGFIALEAPWFLMIGNLLSLWTLGAFIIGLLREVLLSGILSLPSWNAVKVYRVSRWLTLYVLLSIALFLSAKTFRVPQDILALLRFVLSISTVLASLLLLLKKETILGLLPDLPYKIYQVFLNGLRRFYYPAVILTFLTGIAWCFGFKNFASFLWIKTWAVAGAFLVIIFLFHSIKTVLRNWIQKKDPGDIQANLVHKSLSHLLLFLTIVITIAILLKLLGFFDHIRNVVSFPLILIENKPISLWTFLKVIIVFIGIIYVSRLVRSYLDYKIYPMLGLDEGLAYSINTVVSYLLLAIGFIIALFMVGIDLRTLMVFAGAVGIGIGLGLQKITSNLISGFIIIFGRKVRKGDWVEVGDTLGSVQRVTLASTFIWTRDNVEHIIPNTDLIANTITNYSLSDPEVRIHIPVGVSYNANPQEVKRILLEVAQGNELIIKTKQPRVWFTEFGDSSINFELLVWIDIRRFSEKFIKSRLYFTIFEAFQKAGIEIPFPQRDLHFKSGYQPTGKE